MKSDILKVQYECNTIFSIRRRDIHDLLVFLKESLKIYKDQQWSKCNYYNYKTIVTSPHYLNFVMEYFGNHLFTGKVCENQYILRELAGSHEYIIDTEEKVITEFVPAILIDSLERLVHNNSYKKWRRKMNEIIIDLFPKTKEAVLIDKWFGSKLNDPLFRMLLKGKESELLEEAQRLENAEKEKSS